VQQPLQKAHTHAYFSGLPSSRPEKFHNGCTVQPNFVISTTCQAALLYLLIKQETEILGRYNKLPELLNAHVR
jgi:hypothetical protein